MGRYLELLKTSRVEHELHGETREDESTEKQAVSRRSEVGEPIVLPFPSKDALRLATAGYRPKVSFSKQVIWRSPDTGFWFSEDMALCFLERRNSGNKSGAEEER